MTRPLPVEAFLADFHDRHPGGTPEAFADLAVRTADGVCHASSYHALCSALIKALPELPPGPVLDLACGDGHLLNLLAALERPRLGVDLSAGELARARARLPDSVALHQARAQSLPLAPRTVAAITCHMALMLMSPPEAVGAELARVLQPGGRLLAVVPEAPPVGHAPPAVFAALTQAMQPSTRCDAWQAVRFEGRRWRDRSLLAELLAPGFRPPRFTSLHGELRLTPEAAWHWLGGMYDLHLLPDAEWPAVRERWTHRIQPARDHDGLISIPHSLLLVDATRHEALLP